MLPIPKDQVAMQECVGEQLTNKESAYKYARYCKTNKAQHKYVFQNAQALLHMKLKLFLFTNRCP